MRELKLQQCRLDGRYDIQDCLGRGSYAEIYVARDRAATEGSPHLVVIKSLNVYLQGDPDTDLERTLIENFQNEAIALDRVRHPNIISRLGHGTAIDLADTTFHYLVLEYMPGGELAARCRHNPLTLERALFYLEQVCAGLAHAHANGVIHRDIKPQNLLLTADGETVKISDFGVAKLDATEGAITRVGTNIYAAPEHNPLVQTGPLDPSALNSLPHLTPAADIYSLAKTAYTMLAGEPPRRFAHNAITELPESISDKSWASSVLRVLQRATATHASERYQTVEDFWADLADAALPPTRPLDPQAETEVHPRVSPELQGVKETVPSAPPLPRFDSTRNKERSPVHTAHGQIRPRIVVPVTSGEPSLQMERNRTQPAREIINAMPDTPQKKKRKELEAVSPPVSPVAKRSTRITIAFGLLLAFSGMLLATHKYIQTKWPTRTSTPQVTAPPPPNLVGQQGTIIQTDVNLRGGPGLNNSAVGLAEEGSRIKVLSVNNNWCEIQVLQHGREKDDPDSSDRGWINKKFIKFD
ncbi:MAG: serine/threonine protein kinase [Pyrinomonadaceae bacterium]